MTASAYGFRAGSNAKSSYRRPAPPVSEHNRQQGPPALIRRKQNPYLRHSMKLPRVCKYSMTCAAWECAAPWLAFGLTRVHEVVLAQAVRLQIQGNMEKLRNILSVLQRKNLCGLDMSANALSVDVDCACWSRNSCTRQGA